jgi:hypothetical protein
MLNIVGEKMSRSILLDDHTIVEFTEHCALEMSVFITQKNEVECRYYIPIPTFMFKWVNL